MANTKVIESLLRETIDTLKEDFGGGAPALEKEVKNGKIAIAGAIENKGITTSPDKGLTELASDIELIQQESYIIDGGEMYAKQLCGSLTTPSYWNLYEVLANLLSDGRLQNYGGILLAEYYRGYDSLALAGAGAGGAYVVSDKDENGNFIMYTNDTTHTWATEFDGKGNRWVAYCFADEYHDFQITDTNTSPRSIFIGRKVGTITSLVNGRISQIVVSDGNELNYFESSLYSQNFGKTTVFRLKNEISGMFLDCSKNTAIENLYLQADSITNSKSNVYGQNSTIQCKGGNISFVIIKANSITNTFINGGDKNISVILDCETIRTDHAYNNSNMYNLASGSSIFLAGVETGNLTFRNCTLKSIYVAYKTNDKTKSFNIVGGYGSTYTELTDIILKDGWCKSFTCSVAEYLTEENMYAHILQRLKQDEPNCGDGVTITLGATSLAKLTSQESQDLLASLRGTYGYTFA